MTGVSPYLNLPLRTRERAAVEIARKCLRVLAKPAGGDGGLETALEQAMREAAAFTLSRIEELVPEATDDNERRGESEQ